MTTLFNKHQKIIIINKYIKYETFKLRKFKKLQTINSSELNRALIEKIFYYIKWLKAKKKYIMNPTKRNSINLKMKAKKKLITNKNYDFLISKI
nr:MAG TPA: hypothetical protein [Caudoviricetes sp.]